MRNYVAVSPAGFSEARADATGKRAHERLIIGIDPASRRDDERCVGVKDNERNIANKIARGSFTAVFFVQCLEAIGCQTIHFESR